MAHWLTRDDDPGFGRQSGGGGEGVEGPAPEGGEAVPRRDGQHVQDPRLRHVVFAV